MYVSQALRDNTKEAGYAVYVITSKNVFNSSIPLVYENYNQGYGYTVFKKVTRTVVGRNDSLLFLPDYAYITANNNSTLTYTHKSDWSEFYPRYIYGLEK